MNATETGSNLYNAVIDDVLKNVKTHMQNEGREEDDIDNRLRRLQQLWSSKIIALGTITGPQIPDSKNGLGSNWPENLGPPPAEHSNPPAVPATKAEAVAPKSEEAKASISESRKRPADGEEIEKEQKPSKKSKSSGDQIELILDCSDDDEDEDKEVDLGEPIDDSYFEIPETPHQLLCSSNKISFKNLRWKATFRSGILNVNGKDYLVTDAQGEFKF
uniref:Uncharacterized protein n=1 Tax=Lotharella oceanica TaxID=641309 RepID=A0A7S2U5U8_9EUKA